MVNNMNKGSIYIEDRMQMYISKQIRLKQKDLYINNINH